jgi:hypothetical protein
MTPRRRLSAWAAATAAGVLLVFAPAVLGLRTLSRRDTDVLYAPVRTLVVEELRAGRLPLWNPHEATGKPLFAEGIHGVLHPVSLLGAAVAPASMDFLLLAYLVLAALGTFALALGLGASPAASAGAGLAFALSGYSASMTGNLVFLAGLSTFPWLLAAARAAGAGWRWGSVTTALATACAFFSGDAQVALVGVGLGALLAADAGGRRGVARALAGIGAGLLLAGVQLVATSALIPRTSRSFDLEDAIKLQWPLEPFRLLELVIPGLARGPLDEAPVSQALTLHNPVFAESVYLGAPLLLAGALGLRERRRTGVLLGAAAAALLWLALGHHLGARQLLDGIPIWSRFRYSEKLMAPLALCGCALAALGVDSFGAARLSSRWRRALAAGALLAVGLLAVLLVAPDATRDVASRLLGEPGPFYRQTLAAGLPHLAVALAALLAVDRLTPGPARARALALLVALAPAAAVFYGAHLGATELRRFTAPLALASGAPAPRLFHPLEPMPSPGDPRGAVDSVTRSEYQALCEAVAVAYRVDTIGNYGAFESRRYETLDKIFDGSWARAVRRFGVTHVVTQSLPHADLFWSVVEPTLRGGVSVQRDAQDGFELWAVPHRPWAFFAERAMAVERTLNARNEVLGLLSRSDDATVVVETRDPPPTAPGRILSVERRAGTVRLEAESQGPSLLVVQDAFWPGWRAAIDGAPAEILAADFLVRAVRWPAGRHRLEMAYDPPELRVGLVLSGLGAVLSLLLAARAARAP